MESCFATGPARAHRDKYMSFNAAVYHGRWASSLEAVAALLPLEGSLRFAWDKDRFVGGGGMAQPGPEDTDGFGAKGMRLDIVDRAISGKLFWAYTHMADYIAEALLHLMRWAESCPCHGCDLTLRGAARHQSAGLRSRIGQAACCMASRRAPECAAGQLMVMARRLLNTANTAVLMAPSTLACDEADRLLILGDLARARRHILLQMQLKVSFWRQLPWVLWGVAHHSRTVAEECAKRALRLFQRGLQQPGMRVHWLAALLCMPGERGWAEMVAFINGENLCRLPLLERMCGRFKFSPVAERWIESRHALIRKQLRLAPHASVLHLAHSAIQPMLRDQLRFHPHFLDELKKFCMQARNPLTAVRSAGFLHHPVMQYLLSVESRRSLNRVFRRPIIELLYHVDSHTLYQELPDFDFPDEDGQPPPAPPPGHPPPAPWPGNPPDDMPPGPPPPPPGWPPGRHPDAASSPTAPP
eukprot:1452633-Lingulodinium_polyedra.AAC.1